MSLLSFLGLGNNDLKTALRKGAVVIDIRSVHEYDQGRVLNSVNIPDDRLASSIDRIAGYNKPIIICSTGESRSNSAVNFLKKNGIRNIHNGGSWERVIRLMNSL
jgi:phage shock protein E